MGVVLRVVGGITIREVQQINPGKELWLPVLWVPATPNRSFIHL